MPQPGVTINFRVSKGAATLSPGTSATDNSGYASTTARLTNLNGDVQVTGCVAPNNAPCQTFTMFATPSSSWMLEPVSGSVQVEPAGQPFHPLVVRVTEGSSPANPVMGVNVVFDVMLLRFPQDGGGDGGGGDDGHGGGNGAPLIVGTYRVQVASDANGLASTLPTVGNVQGYCDLMISAGAGPATALYHLQALSPMEESVYAPVRPRPRRERGPYRQRGGEE